MRRGRRNFRRQLRTIGKIQLDPHFCRHAQQPGIRAVIPAVAGRAADHDLWGNGLQNFLVRPVPLSVVTHLENLGPQGLPGNLAVTAGVGIAGKQDTDAPEVQAQDQTVIVHRGIQGIQTVQELLRRLRPAERPHLPLQLPASAKRRGKHLHGKLRR